MDGADLPDVEVWNRQGTNRENRRLVLDGWLSLLQQRVTKTLVTSEFDNAIYEMVRRAASG